MKVLFALKNIIFYACVMVTILCGTQASANVLQYHVGDSASYSVAHRLDYAIECFGIEEKGRQDISLDFDLKILSCNENTASYPFTVQVLCKNLEVVTNPDAESAEYYEDAALITYLLSHPLQFTLDGEFNVHETTGSLAYAYDMYEDSSFSSQLPSFFELVLTQIFQLSGQDLAQANVYPVSCYQFLNWDDETIDEKDDEVEITQDSAYTINSISADSIDAAWQGKAQVTDNGIHSNGSVTITGAVSWNPTVPLVQQRTLSAYMNSVLDWYFSGTFEVNIQQTISSSPLLFP